MLVTPNKLKRGDRIFHPTAKRLATVVGVDDQLLHSFIDHWPGVDCTSIDCEFIEVVGVD